MNTFLLSQETRQVVVFAVIFVVIVVVFAVHKNECTISRWQGQYGGGWGLKCGLAGAGTKRITLIGEKVEVSLQLFDIF